jgi:hypothetical protein
VTARGKRRRQPQIRYQDPAVNPLGSPRPIGVGSVAKIAKETRQLRRSRARQNAAKQRRIEGHP